MDLWMFIPSCLFSLLMMYMINRLFREWRMNSESAFGSLSLHSLICIESISFILQRTDHSLLVILQWAVSPWSGHCSTSHVLLVMKIRFCKLCWMVKKHLMVDEAFLFLQMQRHVWKGFSDFLKFVLQFSHSRKRICHHLDCAKMVMQCGLFRSVEFYGLSSVMWKRTYD